MKAVVIGHGVMGRHHARTLRRLGAAVQTVDPDPNADADWLEARPLPDADVACIAVPPRHLAAATVAALEQGVSRVLVEKPMAFDLDQAQHVLQAEARCLGRVFVGYTERWNPALSTLREALPMVGTLRHVTGQRLGLKARCPDTGPALDLLTHDIDALRFLDLHPRLAHSVADGDHVTATFALDSGSATLQASHLHPAKQRTLTVTGDEGVLTLDYQRQTVVFQDATSCVEIDVSRREPLEAQWRACLAGEGVTAAAALAVLKVALRCGSVQRGGSDMQDRPPCTAQ